VYILEKFIFTAALFLLLANSGFAGEAEDRLLLEAAKAGNLVEIKAALALGAKIDVQDSQGSTPLHRATIAGNVECVDFLVEQKANLNLQDSIGFTPLMWAIKKGKIGLVSCVLKHRPNLSITVPADKFLFSGKSALGLAETFRDQGFELGLPMGELRKIVTLITMATADPSLVTVFSSHASDENAAPSLSSGESKESKAPLPSPHESKEIDEFTMETTVPLRFPELMQYLESEKSKDEGVQGAKTVVVLGAGLIRAEIFRDNSWGRPLRPMVPQLHEISAVFERDNIVVIDASPRVLEALPLSFYDYYMAGFWANKFEDPVKDYIQKFLKKVPAKLPKSIKSVHADFVKVELSESSVDYIIATFSICYALSNLSKSMQSALLLKFLKALKPGGQLLLDSGTLDDFWLVQFGTIYSLDKQRTFRLGDMLLEVISIRSGQAGREGVVGLKSISVPASS
jgi:hypothetical protein